MSLIDTTQCQHDIFIQNFDFKRIIQHTLGCIKLNIKINSPHIKLSGVAFCDDTDQNDLSKALGKLIDI